MSDGHISWWYRVDVNDAWIQNQIYYINIASSKNISKEKLNFAKSWSNANSRIGIRTGGKYFSHIFIYIFIYLAKICYTFPSLCNIHLFSIRFQNDIKSSRSPDEKLLELWCNKKLSMTRIKMSETVKRCGRCFQSVVVIRSAEIGHQWNRTWGNVCNDFVLLAESRRSGPGHTKPR